MCALFKKELLSPWRVCLNTWERPAERCLQGSPASQTPEETSQQHQKHVGNQ